jgi:hypothetical protein
VPIGPMEIEAAAYRPDKGIRLLGFASRADVDRHHFLGVRCAFIQGRLHTENAGQAHLFADPFRARGCWNEHSSLTMPWPVQQESWVMVPAALGGSDEQRSWVAVSALVQGMERTGKVGGWWRATGCASRELQAGLHACTRLDPTSVQWGRQRPVLRASRSQERKMENKQSHRNASS